MCEIEKLCKLATYFEVDIKYLPAGTVLGETFQLSSVSGSYAGIGFYAAGITSVKEPVKDGTPIYITTTTLHLFAADGTEVWNGTKKRSNPNAYPAPAYTLDYNMVYTWLIPSASKTFKLRNLPTGAAGQDVVWKDSSGYLRIG